MPRRARLDAPDTLHHVMVRGIEKRRIVNDVVTAISLSTAWITIKDLKSGNRRYAASAARALIVIGLGSWSWVR